jgi:hypothetical protein
MVLRSTRASGSDTSRTAARGSPHRPRTLSSPPSRSRECRPHGSSSAPLLPPPSREKSPPPRGVLGSACARSRAPSPTSAQPSGCVEVANVFETPLAAVGAAPLPSEFGRPWRSSARSVWRVMIRGAFAQGWSTPRPSPRGPCRRRDGRSADPGARAGVGPDAVPRVVRGAGHARPLLGSRASIGSAARLPPGLPVGPWLCVPTSPWVCPCRSIFGAPHYTTKLHFGQIAGGRNPKQTA